MNAYTYALFFSAVLASFLAWQAWGHRRDPGGIEFCLLALTATEWALTSMGEIVAATQAAKIVWSVISYLGSQNTPVLFFVFALRYTQQDHWLKPRIACLFFIVPFISFLMAVTNEWHHLLWPTITLTTNQFGTIAVYAHGPWFWVEAVYSYILVGLGIIALLRTVLKNTFLYSLQTRVLLIAATVPLWANIVYAVVPSLVAGLDTTPIAFIITMTITAWAMARYRLLDWLPATRQILIGHLPDGILLLGGRLQIVDANPIARKALNLTSKQILSNCSLDEILPLDSAKLLSKQEEKQNSYEQKTYELAIGQSARTYEVTTVIKYGPKQQEICGFAILHDITERKRAEEERLKIERNLLNAQKLESLGVLAGGIAHDFNNLLVAISGNLELALMDLAPESAARTSLDEATSAAKRATELTWQMLAYSGKGLFHVSTLDISKQVTEHLPALQAMPALGISLCFNLAEGPPLIKADAEQLQQILLSLFTNAIEAVSTETGQITVLTGQEECDQFRLSQSRIAEKPAPGRYVYLEVKDNGQGMDEFTLEHIFEPFFSTKFTGRGLGMSAVLGIVRAHQGAIFIDSQIGKGTSVRVLFPAL